MDHSDLFYQMPEWVHAENRYEMVNQPVSTLSDIFQNVMEYKPSRKDPTARKLLRYACAEWQVGLFHFYRKVLRKYPKTKLKQNDFFREMILKDMSEKSFELWGDRVEGKLERTCWFHLDRWSQMLYVMGVGERSYSDKSIRSAFYTPNGSQYFRDWPDELAPTNVAWCLAHWSELLKASQTCGDRFFDLIVDGTMPYEMQTSCEDPWIYEWN
ncbi:MAG: hypothetical protein AAGM67_00250, partial [Bacteroidota bacterium]